MSSAKFAEASGKTITYILPDLGHAVLLDPILKDAPPGAVIETYTRSMFDLVCERITEGGRLDMVVRLVDAPAVRKSS